MVWQMIDIGPAEEQALTAITPAMPLVLETPILRNPLCETILP
jgi:hypothetical protein